MRTAQTGQAREVMSSVLQSPPLHTDHSARAQQSSAREEQEDQQEPGHRSTARVGHQAQGGGDTHRDTPDLQQS